MINDFQTEIDNRKLILKKDIKITGGNCAKILLILAVATYAIELSILFTMRKANVILDFVGIKNNITNFSKDAYVFFAGYLPCVIGDIIAIIMAYNTTKIGFKKDIFTKPKTTKKFIFLGAVSCIGTGIISRLIYGIYEIVFKILGITIPHPDFAFPKQTVCLVLFVIYVCFLGPILEEIIFRGFIVKSMQRYGNLTAIIVSSVLFSMFHLNLVQFVNPILMGIIFAFIRIKSESIIPSIIAHIFNNTISFIMAAISLLKIPVISISIASIYFFFGIIVFTVFVNNHKGDFIEIIKEDTTILMTYKKVKYSFSGAWALAYIIFYALFIIATMVIANVKK